jgi:hypothetical protein
MSQQSDEDIRKIRIELEKAREQRERKQRDQSNEAFVEALKFLAVLILAIFSIGRPFRDMFSFRINRIIDITGISLLFIGSAIIYVWWDLSNYPYLYPQSVFWYKYETTYGWYGVYILIAAIFLCGSSPYLSVSDKQ